jgi:hypothetical protein
MKMIRRKNLMRKKATMMTMDEKKAERSGHESQ